MYHAFMGRDSRDVRRRGIGKGSTKKTRTSANDKFGRTIDRWKCTIRKIGSAAIKLMQHKLCHNENNHRYLHVFAIKVLRIIDESNWVLIILEYGPSSFLRDAEGDLFDFVLTETLSADLKSIFLTKIFYLIPFV